MRQPPRGKKRGPLTKAYLERAALHYLERYASSVEGLRRVLMRRVDKAAWEERCDPAEATPWVEDVVARYAASGLVDDRSFAEGKAASLRRRGDSARRIALKLREKGVDGELIDTVLEEQDGEDSEAAEIAAACRFARRRRLGPLRAPEEREDRRDRDMAALARAGFSLDIARRVLDLEDADALEEAMRGDTL
ncbi:MULTISPECIES: regulatory protein RecX [Thalassobaculum]|uniref:Regulatory protein RecX n=1 Tax=Thalassobaculum litoreum DSM 18839 TaxID=1123362 RepID=A0A8G2BFH0_9PROT|nr:MULTISPECIES: regulatory protein RecX [Thalassobaculum]SDF24859.1 regulatory protein [Thalassobaculum litoreum DSM 18839]